MTIQSTYERLIIGLIWHFRQMDGHLTGDAYGGAFTGRWVPLERWYAMTGMAEFGEVYVGTMRQLRESEGMAAVRAGRERLADAVKGGE